MSILSGAYEFKNNNKYKKYIICINCPNWSSEVEKFNEIKEALVVGQSWDNDIRIILFVILDTKYNLTEELIMKIKKQIKKNASPRHVPYKIFPIKDIPKTKNGKIVELAVKQTIEGDQIKNLEALVNPDSLNQFKNIKELNE